MIELGIAGGPPVEKHNYTNLHVAAAEQWAESGLRGAMVGAIEIAASHYARAFAVAEVSPAVPALSPAVLGTIARRLIVSGESCHVIDVIDGAVRLLACSSWSVTSGGPDPASWIYQCELPGPHDSVTRTVPGAQVVHCRYATLARRTLARARTVDARRHHGTTRREFGSGVEVGIERGGDWRSGQPDTAAGRCWCRIGPGQQPGRSGGPVRRGQEHDTEAPRQNRISRDRIRRLWRGQGRGSARRLASKTYRPASTRVAGRTEAGRGRDDALVLRHPARARTCRRRRESRELQAMVCSGRIATSVAHSRRASRQARHS